MSDINTPNPEEEGTPSEASSYDIQPPPTEDGEVPGVPDASGALDEGTEDDPGANATGVGV